MDLLTKRRNMNTEEKVILLAKLLQVKELQTHLVKEEQKIKEEISRIENLELERKELREPNDITGDLWK
jgi:hypothetical protein